ncbi:MULTISPECIES: hypothetical protein [Enterobacter]|uniref:hypothetical protein n=1 Tax=Enterobacter TaxID=547 RepID=UPI0011132B5A|nr:MULTISPECIES: hypothetical protein [Enterobacter cloacae complex]MEC5764077.1 hypothetical protein [Enterobacter chengduensis]NBC78021.1 hypothetical protein [Enterobacter asburiae]HBM9902935.1 hypothetical protein [Enterobacter chengduensis]
MVDVANDHAKTLDIKQRFIFISYTRIQAAIPALFGRGLRERMFIGKGVNSLLILPGNYAGVMHNLDKRLPRDRSNLLIVRFN